jgi:hypothetical protein
MKRSLTVLLVVFVSIGTTGAVLAAGGSGTQTGSAAKSQYKPCGQGGRPGGAATLGAPNSQPLCPACAEAADELREIVKRLEEARKDDLIDQKTFDDAIRSATKQFQQNCGPD